MAFYKDYTKGTRQDRKESAEQRGGFDDEGSRYGARGNGSRGDNNGNRTNGRSNRSFSDNRGARPVSGDRPDNRGPRSGDRPDNRGPRSFGGDRPDNRGPRSFGGDRPDNRGPRSFGGDRPDNRGPRSFGGDRPDNRGPRSFGGDRPDNRGPRSFGGDRPDNRGPRSGDRPDNRGPRTYGGDRPDNRGPRSFGGDRPDNRGPRTYGGDRPDNRGPRSFGGDRPDNRGPRTYGGDRPDNRGPRTYGNDRPDNRGNRSNGRGGDFRFAPSGQQPYAERGNGTKPRSYDETRQARQTSAPRRDYESYRYDAPVVAPRAVPVPVETVEDAQNLLTGRNPIREALKSGHDIEKLLIARGELSGSAREIVAMAKEAHVPIQEVERTRLDQLAANHQGMIAYASAYQYSTVQAMLDLAKERGEEPFLVLLDGVTDPHNLGAIIRSAECAGAHGVIVPERRAVGLTPAAVKASAGAVEYLPVARVTNLNTTIEELKAQNIWIYAADMEGEDYRQVDFKGAVALVIGAEGEGVSRLVLEKCDKRVALPIRGKVDSLNASVAAGVLLYEVLRAR